jgi:hypothetical protein
MKSRYSFILIPVIFVFCMTTLMTSMVEARGDRGGGGFSRGGPAASGGFSSRPARQSRVSQTPRQTTKQEQSPDLNRDPEDRQERREARRERRDDGRDDYYDNYYHYGGVAYLTYVPCSTTVVIDDITYYHCDSTWYTRGYKGGDVVYIVTSAPEGY